MHRPRHDSTFSAGPATASARVDRADTLQVALFAGMAEAAGTRAARLRWTGGVVADLREALTAAYPAIGPLLARSAVAVDNRYAADDAQVPVAADVAIIPPVSGG